MRQYYILIFILLGINFLTSAQKNNIKNNILSQEEFLKQPLGFNEDIESFKQNSTNKFKIKKYTKSNEHYPEVVDTFYQFYFRKSEVFFIRTHQGKEFLIAGKIMDKKITLVNDIHVKMSKEDFIAKFTDDLVFDKDRIEMIGEGTKYTFIFKKDKLYRINIDNYFD